MSFMDQEHELLIYIVVFDKTNFSASSSTESATLYNYTYTYIVYAEMRRELAVDRSHHYGKHHCKLEIMSQ